MLNDIFLKLAVYLALSLICYSCCSAVVANELCVLADYDLLAGRICLQLVCLIYRKQFKEEETKLSSTGGARSLVAR